MSTQLQKRVEMLTEQQNHIAVSLSRTADAVNNQAQIIQHMTAVIERHDNAIINIMNWLGEELGPEAVERLRDMLGVDETKQS